jgi:hypothetical protein
MPSWNSALPGKQKCSAEVRQKNPANHANERAF